MQRTSSSSRLSRPLYLVVGLVRPSQSQALSGATLYLLQPHGSPKSNSRKKYSATQMVSGRQRPMMQNWIG